MDRGSLYVLGSSHASRILLKAKNHPMIVAKFNIKNYTRRGAKFKSLVLPAASEMKPGDVIICQLFGNDLIDGKMSITTDEFQQRKMHMARPKFPSQEVLDRMYIKFRDYLLTIPQVRVIVVDNILRYVCGCPNHQAPGLVRHQHQQNKRLAQILGPLPNTTVLDHRRIIQVNPRTVRHGVNHYRKLLTDNVHLYEQYYEAMVSEIYKRFLN